MCCFSGSNIILAIMEGGGERWCACMCPKQPWLDSVYCTESLTAVAMETTLPSSEDTRFRFLTLPLFPDSLMKVQLLVGPELSSIFGRLISS